MPSKPQRTRKSSRSSASQSKKIVAKKKTSAVQDVASRDIPKGEQLRLFVGAGGRCQFDSCNEYVLEHHVTKRAANFGQMAHIVAFSKKGPRGGGKRPKDINASSNLMLLCGKCHKEIDDNPGRYTRETLEGYKKANEARIRHVTGLGPDMKTSLLMVRSKIGGVPVSFPFDHLLSAITPRYPHSRDGKLIDLTQLDDRSPRFVDMAVETINREVRAHLESGEVKQAGHMSVFALAPIPVLVALGAALGNKIAMAFFQRHRDTEDWAWKKSPPAAKYLFREIRAGRAADSAVLVLSLSGSLTVADLPPEIDADATVFEIVLDSEAPTPTFLKSAGDLETFKIQYQNALAAITRQLRGIKTLSLIPAVPAPIAILCGRELLPKTHPALRVYDRDKGRGGFIFQTTVNQ